jgi:hypothetical protein
MAAYIQRVYLLANNNYLVVRTLYPFPISQPSHHIRLLCKPNTTAEMFLLNMK